MNNKLTAVCVVSALVILMIVTAVNNHGSNECLANANTAVGSLENPGQQLLQPAPVVRQELLQDVKLVAEVLGDLRVFKITFAMENRQDVNVINEMVYAGIARFENFDARANVDVSEFIATELRTGGLQQVSVEEIAFNPEEIAEEVVESNNMADIDSRLQAERAWMQEALAKQQAELEEALREMRTATAQANDSSDQLSQKLDRVSELVAELVAARDAAQSVQEVPVVAVSQKQSSEQEAGVSKGSVNCQQYHNCCYYRTVRRPLFPRIYAWRMRLRGVCYR